MDPDRVGTIAEWSVPKYQPDIQVFLGFAKFYRRFVDGYFLVVLLLANLLGILKKFPWTPKAQEAFGKLKTMFATAP